MTKEEVKGLKVTRHGEEKEKTRSGQRSQETRTGQEVPLPEIPGPGSGHVKGQTSPPSKNIKSFINLRSSSGGGGSGRRTEQNPNNQRNPPSPPPTTPPDTHSPSQNGLPEEQVTAPEPTRQTNKCCLCWCCCCSCSCSALRNNQENRTKPKDPDSDLNCDPELSPSMDEIRSWGESFDKLMRNVAGRKVFREFLKCEYSEENILFWLACEELRKESKAELIEEKARLIYEDYISILSPKEVSLDSRVREVVNQNMVDPSPHTFDEAQVQIYTLMHRDSYPRFVNSIMYKKLAGLNLPHRGSSVSTGGLRSNPASRKESLAA